MSQCHSINRATETSPGSAPPGAQHISATENDVLLESSSSSSQTKERAVLSSPTISTTRLHRSSFIVLLVLLYAALAIFAWTVTVILSFRPISGQAHYGAWFPGNDDYGVGGGNVHQFYVKAKNWYHAARVIQSIVGVVTIPLTSAVCSNAVIVFIAQRHKSHLSLRKVITLADKSWNNPAAYPRIAFSWKRYGTYFLLLAFLLNTLGAVLSPLQEILLSTKTIKTPVLAQNIPSLFDIPNLSAAHLFGTNEAGNANNRDTNLITTITQNALLTASNVEPQSQLWQGAGLTCGTLGMVECGINSACQNRLQHYFDTACGQGNTLGNLSRLVDPFLAELPNGFSTGLIRQFVPRINSTAKYENISLAEWPHGCDQLPGAFFAEYSEVLRDVRWGIQTCMPANLTQSPWKSTRARQDFSEELYINITGDYIEYGQSGGFFCVTVNTTAGYFELPNYMNNLAPGPLLEQGPDYLCGSDCESEGEDRLSPSIYFSDLKTPPQNYADSKRDVPDMFTSSVSNNTIALEGVYNKGPLLTIAMALFGENSFIASHTAFPQAYYGLNSTLDPATQTEVWSINQGACVGLFPMTALLLITGDTGDTGDGNPTEFIEPSTQGCITNDLGSKEGGTGGYVGEWVQNFNPGSFIGMGGDVSAALQNLASAFTSASFLANQAWLMNNIQGSSQRSLTVAWDSGVDTEVPTISLAGIILISILLGIDLLALLAMAIYASFSPTWTKQLDAFALLRIGAALGDRVPLLVGLRTHKIKALDELPGWIGDAADEHEDVGRLGVGASRRIDKKKRYECYKDDEEQDTPKKKVTPTIE
ncbi:hypothetical protein LARI1_G005501 [Lachnellula arida]|uniref:Uncharacterized protein n=1 Tax=Lachnellula arida TaxID=1316785 RepID=A0A8T9BF95_9HELO|nr:hypothetical protein LARI1_G005501 [Lachnellula arida]